jgi:hypothetical protein
MLSKSETCGGEMTQAPAERRRAKTKPVSETASGLTADLTADSVMNAEDVWRLGTAAAAAMDQLDRPTIVEEEYDRHLGMLTELESEGRAGRVARDELVARRAALIDHLRETVEHLAPGPQLARLSRVWQDADLSHWLGGLYVPTALAPANAPVDHRYAVHWSSADLPGMAQVKTASVETGALHVVNLTLPARGSAAGYAQAGVGILMRPTHAISRITFRPEASYHYRHIIDTPRVRSYVPWSTAVNKGQVRLVAQRINPLTGSFETYAQHAVPLWNDSVGTGSQLWQDAGGGSFPGADPGLQFIGTSGDLFALWLIASAYCAKNDEDPTAYTICQANIDCEVPSMWVDESPLV